jgi:flagellar biosynthesis protein
MKDYELFAGKKKVKTAIAIGYDEKKDDSPRVLATGKNLLAQQIIEAAEKSGVHIEQNADLAQILSIIEVNSYIPVQAYEAVAEILSYLYNKKNNK